MLADSFVLRTPPERKPRKRCAQAEKMDKKLFIILSIFISLSCYSQTEKDHFDCLSNDLFFPDYIFPVIEFKTVYNDTESVSQDYELLSKYRFDFMDDTASTYAIALDSTDLELNTYYSDILTKFQEPVLCDLKEGTEIYRLTWLRTFHHPIVIRLKKKGSEFRIYWKVGNGLAGFDEVKRVIKKGSRNINQSDFTELITKFDQIDFWNRINYRDIPQNDGSTFLLEASNTSNYNALIYSGDLRHTEYMNVCKMLIDFTRLRIKKNEFY